MLKKVRLSKLSRFSLDLLLSLTMLLAFYAVNFFLSLGEITAKSIIAFATGLLAPNLFIANNEKDR